MKKKKSDASRNLKTETDPRYNDMQRNKENQQTQQMLYSFQNKNSLSFNSHISKALYDSANQVNFLSPQCLSNISQGYTPNKSNQQSYENEIRKLLGDFKEKEEAKAANTAVARAAGNKADADGVQPVSKFGENHRDLPDIPVYQNDINIVQKVIKKSHQIVWSQDPLDKKMLQAAAQSISPTKLRNQKPSAKVQILYQDCSNPKTEEQSNSQRPYGSSGMSSVAFGSYPVSSQISGRNEPNPKCSDLPYQAQNLMPSSKNVSQRKTSEGKKLQSNLIPGAAHQNHTSSNMEQSFNQNAEGNECVKLDNINVQFNGQSSGEKHIAQNQNISPDFQCNQIFGQQIAKNKGLHLKNQIIQNNIQMQFQPGRKTQTVLMPIAPISGPASGQKNEGVAQLPKKSKSTSTGKRRNSNKSPPMAKVKAQVWQNCLNGKIALPKDFLKQMENRIFDSPDKIPGAGDRKLISKKFLSQAKENSKNIGNGLISNIKQKKAQNSIQKQPKRLRTEISPIIHKRVAQPQMGNLIEQMPQFLQRDHRFASQLQTQQNQGLAQEMREDATSPPSRYLNAGGGDVGGPPQNQNLYFSGSQTQNEEDTQDQWNDIYQQQEQPQTREMHIQTSSMTSSASPDSRSPVRWRNRGSPDTMIRNQSPYFETKHNGSKIVVPDQQQIFANNARMPLQDISINQHVVDGGNHRMSSPAKIQRLMTNNPRNKIILLKPDQIQNSRNILSVQKHNQGQNLERSRTQTLVPNDFSFEKNTSTNVSHSRCQSPGPPRFHQKSESIDLIAKLKKIKEEQILQDNRKEKIMVNLDSKSPRSQNLKSLIDSQVNSLEDVHFIKVYLRHKEVSIRQKMAEEKAAAAQHQQAKMACQSTGIDGPPGGQAADPQFKRMGSPTKRSGSGGFYSKAAEEAFNLRTGVKQFEMGTGIAPENLVDSVEYHNQQIQRKKSHIRLITQREAPYWQEERQNQFDGKACMRL